jgi:hypothetical protein
MSRSMRAVITAKDKLANIVCRIQKYLVFASLLLQFSCHRQDFQRREHGRGM